MARIFHIHPESPQKRLIEQAVELIRQDAIAIVPTDACYAMVCKMNSKPAIERIKQIKSYDDKHLFTIMCRDLSELASFARIDNVAFRLLKAHTPGPYTFILNASGEAPKQLYMSKRRTVGARIPSNPILQLLLRTLEQPLVCTTLQMPGESIPMHDPDVIFDAMKKRVDLMVDGGWGSTEYTTLVELTDKEPKILREGVGKALCELLEAS